MGGDENEKNIKKRQKAARWGGGGRNAKKKELTRRGMRKVDLGHRGKKFVGEKNIAKVGIAPALNNAQ